ncbi:MAG: NFACT RNA binding domain-containing protein, partial [Treponema sp.]
MSLNCNEINVVLSELDFTGAFIQEIVQPGYDTIAFRIFKNGTSNTLLVCTSANACRLNISNRKIPKNAKPLRFNEFLKSRIKGSKITSIKQLGLDRIILIELTHNGEEKFLMYIRLWSGASNIIVTDTEGNILDCMYRRPSKGEVTGGKFSVEEKIPTDEEKIKSLERFPVRTFSEITTEGKQFSFNEKVDMFYSEHATVLSRESLLQNAEKWYNEKHSRMKAALDKLNAKKAQFENAEKLKHIGDLILSYGAQAQGSSLDCTDYDTGKEVHIRLDAKKSVQENAAVYYEQYKKAVSGMDALEHDISLSEKALAALDAEYNAMLTEKNELKIEQMLRHDTSPKQNIQKKHAGLHYEINGWTIIVGRTANENDDLLRHTVKGADLWLHTRDYSGGYVFIKARSGKTVPLEILLYAGNLAVYHSKARKNGQADLYYTNVKYLRRAKNGPKGLVLPTHEKNLLVKIDEEKMKVL